MVSCLWTHHPLLHRHRHPRRNQLESKSILSQFRLISSSASIRPSHRICCNYDDTSRNQQPPNSTGIQVYLDIERGILVVATPYASGFDYFYIADEVQLKVDRCLRFLDDTIRSYYGISRNLLIKFKDDAIDETSTLAQVLSSESAISSMLDMSIRFLPGDHGLPLQQALPDVPPAMADAVNRGSEMLANLTMGTPWETVAKKLATH
ncbi:hypothetical protein LWI28_025781 [Acer negundo]|uniref:Uncharacterized protein n=1 Tax=Acer negundo TaxID=4023 RepID=A0AAD5NGF1_ACENE|nr:hypothetical protein LWI28_025781 [Acer negundo]